jgi:hypothetical protein
VVNNELEFMPYGNENRCRYGPIEGKNREGEIDGEREAERE